MIHASLRRFSLMLAAGVALLPLACSHQAWLNLRYRDVPLTEGERRICADLHLDPAVLADLKGRPLYTFAPRELDIYLRYARRAFPGLRDRLAHLGRKNVGQPYEIYLLGEFPFEVHDPQPLFNLGKSDCVVFSEHLYAMALGHDWSSFFQILQRLRYRGGQIGVLTRNHWTERDWDRNNDWLIEDRIRELGDGRQWSEYHQTIRRSVFFMRRFGLGADLPDEEHTWAYIPLGNLPNVLDDLQTGDFVNVIRGSREEGWAGHTGVILRDPDGTVNFLHSSPPAVRVEPLTEYARRSSRPGLKTPTIGFRFFRLRVEELERAFAVSDADLRLPVPDPDFGRPGRHQTETGDLDWVGPASPEATSD